jgi:hypothetical protein
MQSCLEALPSPIEFVGDSHLRFAYNEIISRTDSNARNLSLGKLKTTHTYNKFQFSYGGYAVEHATDVELMSDSHGVLPCFKSLLNASWIEYIDNRLTKWQKRERRLASLSNKLNQSSTDRRTLVISFGTWDTARIHVKYFLTKALVMLHNFFELRRSDTILSKVKVVITTIPAVTEQPYIDVKHPTAHSCLSNNAMLAAVSRLLADIALKFDDVSIADWFGVSLSRSHETDDGIHHLRFDGVHLNDVGLGMMRLLVEQVCPIKV